MHPNKVPSTWGNAAATQHCALSSIFNCGNMPLGLKGSFFLHQTKGTYVHKQCTKQRLPKHVTMYKMVTGKFESSLHHALKSNYRTMKIYNSLPWNIKYWWVQFNKKRLHKSCSWHLIDLLSETLEQKHGQTSIFNISSDFQVFIRGGQMEGKKSKTIVIKRRPSRKRWSDVFPDRC